jgi:hypothetical protein
VGPQEPAERARVAFADLPEHPAAGLVHEVVAVAEQGAAEGERVAEVPAPDERERRHDRDPPPPKAAGGGEAAKHAARATHEVLAEEARGGEVHEIPVVEAVERAEVEAGDACAAGRGGAAGLAVPRGEGEEALLVPRGGEKAPQLGVGQEGGLLRDGADAGDADAEEAVGVAVAPGGGLEEAAELRRAAGVREPAELPAEAGEGEARGQSGLSSLRFSRATSSAWRSMTRWKWKVALSVMPRRW